MTVPPAWRKSSHSSGAVNSDCVEVADLTGAVAIRDSKNLDARHLTLTPDAFATLLTHLKHGDRAPAGLCRIPMVGARVPWRSR